MRKLAWFAAGFGAACLWACYSAAPVQLLGPLLLALGAWLSTRPRPGEALPLRRPQGKGPRARCGLYQFSRRALALCLGAVLAFCWAAAYAALFRAPAAAWVGEDVPLSGELASYPTPTSTGGCSAVLRLDGGLAAPDVLVYGGADWAGLEPGDRVTCTARVVPSTHIRGDETPYYTAKGVYLPAYCRGELSVCPAGRVPLRYWPARCAHALRGGIDAAFGDAAPLAAAVTLGDKSALDPSLRSALNRAGLMHAAVVSGFHISFLVRTALLLLGGRRKAALAILPFLVFYALMAGGTPSAFRAVVMQCALLLAPLAQREEDGPTALGAALLVLLVQNPFAAAGVGLQLSFASVAGILLASRPLTRWLCRPLDGLSSRRLRRAGAAALTTVATSLGAMLFTAPLIALHFGQVLLLSPLSNVLALWALSLLMVCALVLGTLALTLPGPAALLGAAASIPARYAQWVALGLGRFPFASLSADSPYCLIFLMGTYLAVGAAFCGRGRPRRPWVPLLVPLALLCGAIGLGRLEADAAELTVAALDVGQGSSTALVSGGRTALVDCGGDGFHNPGDVAADYFAAMGRTRLDVLALTHFDADHVNGVEQLLHRMEVALVAIPGGGDAQAEARFRALAAAEGSELLVVDELQTLPLGEAVLTLYPPLGGGTSNESGLFAQCTGGEFDVLITGDADAFVERMLVKYYPIPDIELLIAGHHGADGSTSAELLQAAAPELAIVSAGAGNPYGHPGPEALARLGAFGVEVHRTGREGTVTVRVAGDKVSVY